MRSNPLVLSALLVCSGFLLGGCQHQAIHKQHSTDPQTVAHRSIQNDQSIALDSAQMMQHLQALEKIAHEHGGNRAVGTSGGQASASYIVNEIKKAGLEAQLIPFENRHKKIGQNVIVEIKGKSKDTAIIVGGHYDSVEMGPGINDNGTGVAVMLELLKYYAKSKSQHTLYFAFWDSEEDGIGGSQAFVSKLTDKQLEGIQAYINLDMVGTKNPTIQIADGDKSSINDMEQLFKANGASEVDYKPLTDSLRQLPIHPKDQLLERYQRSFFKDKGLDIKEDLTTLTSSDTAPFLGKVPVTSIIMFNEQLNDNEELLYAPCYHKACDTIDLVDPQSLKIVSEATVYLINRIQ